jgi:hypothetical protein
MKKVLERLSLAIVFAASLTIASLGQTSDAPVTANAPKGRYTVLAPRLYPEQMMPSTSTLTLRTWNGSYVHNGITYRYNMVGAAPSSNSSVYIPVYIIPMKIVVGASGRQTTFDPEHILSNGKSVVTNTIDSPLFTSSIDYTLGTVNVGTTQYVDAFQRANFWGTVRSHTNSHLLLDRPTVLPEKTLTVPTYYGKTGTPFGYKAGLVDINWFDGKLPSIMAAEGIQPNAFAIFLTYDVYLTQGGSCCIGGYHSSEGNARNPQSYAEATYIDHNTFAQDVSALSHEIGEWADDPLTLNPNGNETPCGMLETGDPLENSPNFGDFAYKLNGFTYHLQDLVFLRYFGAPASTSANAWFSFHHAALGVCSNGS